MVRRLKLDPLASLVTQLKPTKRILCLCPISQPVLVGEHPAWNEMSKRAQKAAIDAQKFRRKGLIEYNVGMAISDPHRSFAMPLKHSNVWRDRWNRPDSQEIRCLADAHMEDVPLMQDWLDECLGDYKDIGAVTLAFPMKHNDPGKEDELVTLPEVREDIWTEFLEFLFLVQYIPLDGILVSQIDQRLSWKEVHQLSMDKPEMWEGMKENSDDELKDCMFAANPKTDPSLHAFVALNHFLWDNSGK